MQALPIAVKHILPIVFVVDLRCRRGEGGGMANIVNVKIDVRKLDKARFFEGKPDKDGHRPLYADIVLFPKKEVGQFGDTHFCKQSKKKDEQVELPIIGNATERGATQAPAAKPATRQPTRPAPQNLDEDGSDTPF
jgi:hypothetical protein